MIVRISGEGQYRLDDSHHDKLDELDNAVVAAVDADDVLEQSDVIIPPPDVSFEEARAEFSGEGLIPG